MAQSDSFKEFVLDQLHGVGDVTCRSMFGGHGLYKNNTFFGIVFGGRLYFRTTAKTLAEYQERGMQPFRPNAKMTLHTYYEVPVEIIEDLEQLTRWAESPPRRRAAARSDGKKNRRKQSSTS